MKEYEIFVINEEVVFINMFCFVWNFVECVFGRFKVWWVLLIWNVDLKLKMVLIVVYSCFVFYNYCEIKGNCLDDEEVWV